MASDSENPLVIKTAASFRDLRMYEPSSYERAYAPRPIPSGSNPTLFESLGTERGDKCLQLRRRRSCERVHSQSLEVPMRIEAMESDALGLHELVNVDGEEDRCEDCSHDDHRDDAAKPTAPRPLAALPLPKDDARHESRVDQPDG